MLFSFFFCSEFGSWSTPITLFDNIHSMSMQIVNLRSLFIHAIISFQDTRSCTLKESEGLITAPVCSPFMRQARNHATRFKCQQSRSQKQPEPDFGDLRLRQSISLAKKSTAKHLSPHVVGAPFNEQLAQNEPFFLHTQKILDCHAYGWTFSHVQEWIAQTIK